MRGGKCRFCDQPSIDLDTHEGYCLSAVRAQTRFEGWLLVADMELFQRAGVMTHDVPDFNWRHYFDNGRSVEEAISDYLENTP